MNNITINEDNMSKLTIEESNFLHPNTTAFLDLEYFKENFEKQLLKKLFVHPTFEHKCNNCGGTIELDIDKHIFRCPYCGSVYAIGTSQIYG